MGEDPGRPDALTPELRDRLLYYGARAPSPHNAQGWRIESHGPGFRVWRDPDHQVLREFDPGGRESDLACGAVVANLSTGARALGFDAEFGTIEPGKSARLLAVAIPRRTIDVEEYLVTGIEPEQLRWVE